VTFPVSCNLQAEKLSGKVLRTIASWFTFTYFSLELERKAKPLLWRLVFSNLMYVDFWISHQWLKNKIICEPWTELKVHFLWQSLNWHFIVLQNWIGWLRLVIEWILIFRIGISLLIKIHTTINYKKNGQKEMLTTWLLLIVCNKCVAWWYNTDGGTKR